MSMESICFITDRYPTKEYPVNTFLEQLVYKISQMGIDCTVIAPYSPIADKIKKNNYNPPREYIKKTESGGKIKVFCPKMFMFTNGKKWGINFADVYQCEFENVINKIIKKNNLSFSAFYGHFILPSGIAAVKMGELYDKPSFIANGESSLDSLIEKIEKEKLKEKLDKVNGVVAVSTKNKDEILSCGIVPEDKIKVFVNSIDTNNFYKKDKKKAREELGFSQSDFIVAFVGHFIERKGSLRVSEAIKKLSGVKSIFIGKGRLEPNCEGILFKGRLPHNELCTYLNAADVFVLPTLAEGCCNAIVEAMACGLPIISSDLPFNDDILDETNSIRINPLSTQEIAEAIEKLKEDKMLRNKLSEGAIKTAEGLTIDKRAERIIDFMNEKSVKTDRMEI